MTKVRLKIEHNFSQRLNLLLVSSYCLKTCLMTEQNLCIETMLLFVFSANDEHETGRLGIHFQGHIHANYRLGRNCWKLSLIHGHENKDVA